jgi:hypothetical protein
MSVKSCNYCFRWLLIFLVNFSNFKVQNGFPGMELQFITLHLWQTYSWRQRPGREFTVSSAVINGNLDPVGPDMYA